MLLWLWCRPAAVGPIQPLAWEPPYAAGAALKSNNKTKQKNVLFCTPRRGVDLIPVSEGSGPHSPRHASTCTQVQG